MNSRKPVDQTNVRGPALCNWRATVAGAGHQPSDASGTCVLDGVVFTAGIGENHADVGSRICRRLEWLGLSIDDAANALVISAHDSQVKVLVIPTDDMLQIRPTQ
ncbi:hypothetical protein [Sphingobium sp. D43FB]|uniref:hypothetical protein n=1 Tax=Sphingobium sp. D43FB TaxID=2017595 RepID=UPI0020D078FC|nr:hypothetical protein [Sphingobium sp. D43FB]